MLMGSCFLSALVRFYCDIIDVKFIMLSLSVCSVSLGLCTKMFVALSHAAVVVVKGMQERVFG